VIIIVDYGMGNLGSIRNMLGRLGLPAELSGNPDRIATAERIIIPGVGAFDQGMQNIAHRRLRKVLDHVALDLRRPVLGICLGMQLLGHASEEGKETGLGWVDAACRRFEPKADANGRIDKVPHMGWNYLHSTHPHPLLEGADADTRFYFVHSYHAVCDRPQDVIASSWFGAAPFTAALAHNNIAGVQFHPEKSHRFGMRLLQNFSRWQPKVGSSIAAG
jgi:glutamine amidotransferase